MAVNNDPLLTGKPINGRAVWLPATTANTKSDGTGTIGTDMLLLYTADSSYGGFVQKIRLNPQASTAATATTATVVRVYISSQASGATTNANTTLYAELACPAQTADQTATATNPIEIPIGIALKAGENILVSMHAAAAANTSWGFYCVAGDYLKVA
jgi:hypothetical protein